MEKNQYGNFMTNQTPASSHQARHFPMLKLLFTSHLCIPRRFAHANGLINKKCDLIIRDERQRSWSLRLFSYRTGVCIKGGWHEFRDANCLKEGDHIMFEVVTDGEKLIWQFHGKFSHLSNLLHLIFTCTRSVWSVSWVKQFRKHFAF